MVAIVGYFYFGQDSGSDKAAVLRATDEATRWLLGSRATATCSSKSTRVHIAYDHAILQPDAFRS